VNRNVLITRVDENGLEWAKQLFSSVYFNAGWKDDLLLLAHRIPEGKLKWFSERGILIQKCKPLYSVGDWGEYSASKLYIFSTEMKKWKNLICLDSDIIVRSSLAGLTKINGFAAAPDIDRQLLFDQFDFKNADTWTEFKNIEKNLHRSFDLTKLSFNGGVIALNTKIIKKTTFSDIERLLWSTRNVCKYADQTALNMYYYNNWEKLPLVYNLHPLLYYDKYGIKKKNIDAVIFHFSGNDKKIKPNYKKNPYYKSWLKLYKKSTYINKKKVLGSGTKWSDPKIFYMEFYYLFFRLLKNPTGIVVRKTNAAIKIFKFNLKIRFPKLYEFSKKTIRNY
jgi:lipopolysaccharide biosynthesis glycosyltransferase